MRPATDKQGTASLLAIAGGVGARPAWPHAAITGPLAAPDDEGLLRCEPGTASVLLAWTGGEGKLTGSGTAAVPSVPCTVAIKEGPSAAPQDEGTLGCEPGTASALARTGRWGRTGPGTAAMPSDSSSTVPPVVASPFVPGAATVHEGALGGGTVRPANDKPGTASFLAGTAQHTGRPRGVEAGTATFLALTGEEGRLTGPGTASVPSATDAYTETVGP
jgi:hypothetical protein